MLMSHEIEDNVIDQEINTNNAALSRSRGAYQTSQKITEKEEDTGF